MLDIARKIKVLLKSVPEFIRSIYGYLALKLGRSNLSLLPLGTWLDFTSKSYEENSFGQATIITPCNMHLMTTFFDVEPFSPDGALICVTKVPFINRIPFPGDLAQICIIDVKNKKIKAVYNTKGWGAQLGANVQWLDNSTLVFNELGTNGGHGIKIDINNLCIEKLDGPIYGISPCKEYSYSGNLSYVNRILPGYGVPTGFTPGNTVSAKHLFNEGIWRTSLKTGEKTLFITLHEILDKLEPNNIFKKGTPYIFNVKVSPDGEKLFAVMFCKNVPKRIGRIVQLITLDIKTKKLFLTVSDEMWRRGGHHPNWCNDSETILMNLRYPGKKMQFVKINYTGSNIEVITPDIKGGGHPSFNKTGDYIVTDAYVTEGYKDSSDCVPIRLIDVKNASEHELARVYTKNIIGPRRVDPHPVWSSIDQKIVFNAVFENKRVVMVYEFNGHSK